MSSPLSIDKSAETNQTAARRRRSTQQLLHHRSCSLHHRLREPSFLPRRSRTILRRFFAANIRRRLDRARGELQPLLPHRHLVRAWRDRARLYPRSQIGLSNPGDQPHVRATNSMGPASCADRHCLAVATSSFTRSSNRLPPAPCLKMRQQSRGSSGPSTGRCGIGAKALSQLRFRLR